MKGFWSLWFPSQEHILLLRKVFATTLYSEWCLEPKTLLSVKKKLYEPLRNYIHIGPQ